MGLRSGGIFRTAVNPSLGGYDKNILFLTFLKIPPERSPNHEQPKFTNNSGQGTPQ